MIGRPGSPETTTLESPFGSAPRRNGAREIPLRDIRLDDTGYRYADELEIRDLCVSLSHQGQRVPVELVGPAPYRVIDGFRRIHALQALGMRSVSAVVHEGITESAAQRMSFVNNVVRKNLSPPDRAQAIQTALQRGRTRAQIAEDFGLSQKQIRRYEALLQLPAELLELVEDGRLSMAHARVLAEVGVREPSAWAHYVRERKLSARGLREHLEKDHADPERPDAPVLVRTEGDVLRVFPFSVHRDAPASERLSILDRLQEAVRFLEDASERRESA